MEERTVEKLAISNDTGGVFLSSTSKKKGRTPKKVTINKSPRSHPSKPHTQTVTPLGSGRELRQNSERERLKCESKISGEAFGASAGVGGGEKGVTEHQYASSANIRTGVGMKRISTSTGASDRAANKQSSMEVERLREVKNNSVKRREQFRIYLSLRRIAIRSRRSRNIVGTYCRR